MTTPHEGEPVDLTNCDREPIHVPGAIQPHGALLAVTEPGLRIVQVSANAHSLLGIAPEALLGQLLDRALDAASVASVHRALPKAHLREVSPLKLHAADSAAPVRDFDGIVHRSGGLVVIELEPAVTRDEVSFSDFYRQVRRAVLRMQSAGRVIELCQLAADEVWHMTGFDRVMAYRFDRAGHGHVIAETRREGLESYLDLHYPASDIPVQARRLYTLNWLRLIVDVAYRPSPILPTDNPQTGEPLDLSHSVLRSVSPIHVEYLQNMGIHASMSVSLLREGALWGLIICHHYAPRFVPYEVRPRANSSGRSCRGRSLRARVARRRNTVHLPRRVSRG